MPVVIENRDSSILPTTGHVDSAYTEAIRHDFIMQVSDKGVLCKQSGRSQVPIASLDDSRADSHASSGRGALRHLKYTSCMNSSKIRPIRCSLDVIPTAIFASGKTSPNCPFPPSRRNSLQFRRCTRRPVKCCHFQTSSHPLLYCFHIRSIYSGISAARAVSGNIDRFAVIRVSIYFCADTAAKAFKIVL